MSFAEKDDNVTTAENVIDDDSSDGSGESYEDETEITSNSALRKETTAKKVQKAFQIQIQRFNRKFDSLQNKLWTTAQSNTIERFVKELALDVHLNNIRDHLGRTMLHAAVEQQNVTLVNCLIRAGFNPNVKEKCGVTPILIAVILNNKEICQLLVESRACVRGPLFTNILSPFAIASKMELNEIVEVLDPSKSDEEDDDIAFYDTVFKVLMTRNFRCCVFFFSEYENSIFSDNFDTNLVE